MSKIKPSHRVTVPSILSRKNSQEKIAALTAYDCLTARLLDRAGIDMILVGDSVGTTFQGLETTLPVTLDEMIYHSRCVSRGVERALVIGDMPFMSYQINAEKALEAAGRFLKEADVAAVKLEGGEEVAETISKIVRADIPVMAHVGLTPQSYHRIGGFRMQGKKSGDPAMKGSWERVIRDALAVEEAGAFSVVLEAIPQELASEITARLTIPTIGIGAGAGCDGQILVSTDMLGMDPDFCPSFVKQYAKLSDTISSAVKSYRSDVIAGTFPEENSKKVIAI